MENYRTNFINNENGHSFLLDIALSDFGLSKEIYLKWTKEQVIKHCYKYMDLLNINCNNHYYYSSLYIINNTRKRKFLNDQLID
jgi:hypothetical protein